jgi:hypothetical protein
LSLTTTTPAESCAVVVALLPVFIAAGCDVYGYHFLATGINITGQNVFAYESKDLGIL